MNELAATRTVSCEQTHRPSRRTDPNRRWNLAYELHVTNYRSVEVFLTRVELMQGVRDATELASVDGKALVDRLALVGTRPNGSDPRIVGPELSETLCSNFRMANLTVDAAPTTGALTPSSTSARFRPRH